MREEEPETQMSDQPGAGRKAAPTLKTIAELTGLGVTTVSRALKNGPELKGETIARVQRVAAEIGYRPNRAGVRLRTGKTHVISFILNQADDMSDYARRLIMGISSELSGTGYHMLVIPQDMAEDEVAPVRYVLENAASDGIIITHTEPHDRRVALLQQHGFPFVSFGQTEAGGHPFFDYDNDDFAFRATQEMLRRGRKRIAILLPPRRYSYSGHQLAGYMRALGPAGLEPMPLDDLTLFSAPPLMRDYARRIATLPERPDGIICGSEGQAMGLMLGLQQAGLRIGEDIDLASKKTTPLLDLVNAPMLRYFEDLEYAGRTLAGIMLRQLAGDAHEPEAVLVLNDRVPD